jgi:hypothetical protein
LGIILGLGETDRRRGLKLINSEREFLIDKVKDTVFDEVAKKAYDKRLAEVREHVLLPIF